MIRVAATEVLACSKQNSAVAACLAATATATLSIAFVCAAMSVPIASCGGTIHVLARVNMHDV